MRWAPGVILGLVLSTSASAFTEIPVCSERDGAGPSHIFHLRGDYVAVVDPLEAKIIAFRICPSNETCDQATVEAARIERDFPPGTRLRRLIRQADQVTLISESEDRRLVVPRDVSGGADTVTAFERKLAEGYVAGNIGGTFWVDGGRRVTTGVDCSGLVSNVWKLGRHVPTRELDAVSFPLLALNRLRLGDAFLLPGHHVMLYRQQVRTDGASLAIRVTHAAPRCGAVCDSIFEIDFFHD